MPPMAEPPGYKQKNTGLRMTDTEKFIDLKSKQYLNACVMANTLRGDQRMVSLAERSGWSALSTLPKISKHFNHGKHGKHGKESSTYQTQYLRKFMTRDLLGG